MSARIAVVQLSPIHFEARLPDRPGPIGIGTSPEEAALDLGKQEPRACDLSYDILSDPF